MNIKWLVFSVATMLTASAFAADGVTPNLDKSTRVLEGAGHINVMADELQFQLAYGQFVADGIEVAVVAGLRDDDDYMSAELGLRAEYNFVSDSAFVPFLGAGVVWANAEDDVNGIDTDAAVFSLGAGGKYFITDDVALALSGNYMVATDDMFVDSEDGEIADDEFRFLFSVRFYFD
jgi:opacity protein-like surface antigen